MSNLPPLPKPACSKSGTRQPSDLYNTTQMRDYGQQCRDAALEEALAITEDTQENTRYDAIHAIKELLK